MLDVRRIYAEDAALELPRGQEVLGRWPDAEITPVAQGRSAVGALVGLLSGASAAESASIPAVLGALEDRAAWARFGL